MAFFFVGAGDVSNRPATATRPAVTAPKKSAAVSTTSIAATANMLASTLYTHSSASARTVAPRAADGRAKAAPP